MTVTAQNWPEPKFNVFTGKPVAEDAPVFAAALLGLEPPRFCAYCARRMIVQVSPDGWTARCSRHGTVDSVSAQR